jgi:hypothetical protein
MTIDDIIVGNEVVCIYDDGTNLTKDKKYKIISIEPMLNWFKVISDDGSLEEYSRRRFITIEEWRDQQLDKLI